MFKQKQKPVNALYKGYYKDQKQFSGFEADNLEWHHENRIIVLTNLTLVELCCPSSLLFLAMEETKHPGSMLKSYLNYT